MKLNLYKVKKWSAYMMAGFLPAIMFIIALFNFGFLIGIMFLFVGIFLSGLLANMLLRHAFTEMLEGSGLLTLTMDSTGVILPFITKLAAPFIHGTLKNKEVDGIYNREIVNYLKSPKRTKNYFEIEDKEAGITRRFLELPTEKDSNEYLFSFSSFPTFIFNKNIDAYLSKEALSTFEKDVFTKQNSLFILKKTEELYRSVRDFARYIVEHAKPKKGGLLASPWLKWIIIAVAVMVLLILFAPAILNAVSGLGSGAASGGGSAPSSGPIT